MALGYDEGSIIIKVWFFVQANPAITYMENANETINHLFQHLC